MTSLSDVLVLLATSAPYLAILFLLLHYFLRRAVWRSNRRKDRIHIGFCPSSAALAVVFLLTQTFVRPNLLHTVEARLREELQEDDWGGPETPPLWLHVQLRRIRRGEPIQSLVLRLDPDHRAGSKGDAAAPDVAGSRANPRHLHW